MNHKSHCIIIATMLFLILSSCILSRQLGQATSNTTSTSLIALDAYEQQTLALINMTNLYGYDLQLESIALSHPDFRSAGSIGANETANWIKTQFENFALNETSLEPFQFTSWSLLDKPSLIIDVDGNQSTTNDQQVIGSFECEHYSWPTANEGAFNDLVILPLPSAADHTQIGVNPINMIEWNATDTTGKIILTGREVRWSSAWQAALVSKLATQPPAAVVYMWWYEWMNFTPSLYSSTGGRPLGIPERYYWDLHIPVGSVDYEDGLLIRQRENSLNISAGVTVRSVIEDNGTHFNVIGKIDGYADPNKMIIISSHYDSVMCSGFSDNGAGTAAVIELARVFSIAVTRGLYQPFYSLVFIAFTAEELDLIGSVNYIRQHKSDLPNIVAVINLDCIGSDDLYVTQTNPTPLLDLDQTILAAAQTLNLSASFEGTGGSDQESFRVPSWANGLAYTDWNFDANISDASPVESSAMIISHPLLYSDEWSLGEPGWIHTSYDNSTSTATLNWITPQNLANHTAVAALTAMRVSLNLVPELQFIQIWPLLIMSSLLICLAMKKKPSGTK